MSPISNDSFSKLLGQFMRRIRASASGVACEIGLSRESVNNWKNGNSLPNKKHRAKLVACAKYLRLTENETNQLFEAAGFTAEFPLTESLPEKFCDNYLDGLLERLNSSKPYSVTMLLSQASWGEPPFREALINKANQRYGETKVLHIQPPYSLSTDPDEYFHHIAKQCGLKGVESDYDFEASLESILQNHTQLFIIVSRFEQGVDHCREQLAGILRSLSEMYSNKIRILFCGGKRLADLKYQGGDLSLLNIASSEYWSELTTEDLLLISRCRFPELVISQAKADHILKMTGGHPGLIYQVLEWASQIKAFDLSEIESQILASELLWQAFAPIMSNTAYRKRLQSMLEDEELGSHKPYIVDPLLSLLFWQNLIVPKERHDGKFLTWRSPLISEAGKSILSQWHRESA